MEDLIRDAKERERAKREADQRKLDLEKQRLELERKESEHLARELELQTLSLTPSRPVYKKWWFWTIVGGVAVASVATSVAFATRDTVLPAGTLGTADQR